MKFIVDFFPTSLLGVESETSCDRQEPLCKETGKTPSGQVDRKSLINYTSLLRPDKAAHQRPQRGERVGESSRGGSLLHRAGPGGRGSSSSRSSGVHVQTGHPSARHSTICRQHRAASTSRAPSAASSIYSAPRSSSREPRRALVGWWSSRSRAPHWPATIRQFEWSRRRRRKKRKKTEEEEEKRNAHHLHHQHSPTSAVFAPSGHKGETKALTGGVRSSSGSWSFSW